MTKDKQLQSISLQSVLEKSRLDQALNAKEFAVRAGLSYSTARGMMRAPEFPMVKGVVFWKDFVNWRTNQKSTATETSQIVTPKTEWPPAAARILAQAGVI